MRAAIPARVQRECLQWLLRPCSDGVSPAKVEGGQAAPLLGVKEEEGQANTGVKALPASILKRWEKLRPTFFKKSCKHRIWFLPLIGYSENSS